MLDVVKENYDSLTLRLQDSLETYERYSEKPKVESMFFGDLVSVLVKVNERKRCMITSSFVNGLKAR